MSSKKTSNFVVLTILDGWGISDKKIGNAIELAKTPNMDNFWNSYPHTKIEASGEAVGLPQNEAGNTETGHLNIGAGRILYQDLERINMAIAEGDFFKNPVLLKAVEHVKKYSSDLHLMGLVGEGGVHSSLLHLSTLIEMAAKNDVDNLYIHVFTDGRDSPPTSALKYIKQIKEGISREGVGKIASVMGRYWAMDRDLRWERTKRAYKTLTQGSQLRFPSVEEAIQASYDNGRTDEFIEPSIIIQHDRPVGLIGHNDAVIFYNYRIDRPRQLTSAFVMNNFNESAARHGFDPYKIKYEKRHESDRIPHEKPFERELKLNNLFFVTMTEYSKPLAEEGAIPAFPPEVINNTLGEVVSRHGKKQLRITESEKERFVTYYFNGLKEEKFDGEVRVIIPSPSVATYDLQPEMSSEKLLSRLISEIDKDEYQLIVVNFPNPDMVGHTGDLDATIKAIEAVDDCLGEIYNIIVKKQGVLVVTADHGNAEEIIDSETKETVTEHSTNMVPFLLIDKKLEGSATKLPKGILADVAPTILSILNLDAPEDMTGKDLLHKNE